MEREPIPLYGFDLDETLTCGTAGCYAQARRECFADAGVPFPEGMEEAIRAGNLYVPVIVEQLCPGMPKPERDRLTAELYAAIQPRYQAMLAERVRLREGAMEVLETLDSVIITSSWRSDLAIIERVLPQLRPHLRDAVSSDETHAKRWNKPEPHGLALAEARRGKRMAAYVGNDINDLKAARAHGVRAALLRTEEADAQALALADLLLEDLHALLREEVRRDIEHALLLETST